MRSAVAMQHLSGVVWGNVNIAVLVCDSNRKASTHYGAAAI